MKNVRNEFVVFVITAAWNEMHGAGCFGSQGYLASFLWNLLLKFDELLLKRPVPQNTSS